MTSTTASGRRGAITAPHHLATEAGLDVLSRGGNAIEATIAAGAVLAVVYPHMNAIGGDAFFTVAETDGACFGLDGAGPSAAVCTPEAYRARGFQAIPKRGPWAANTVAGMVSVWGAAYEHSRSRWGGKLAWAELLAPATKLAGEGFAANEGQGAAMRGHWAQLSQTEAFVKNFAPGGRIPAKGDTLRQTALAESLALLAHEGANGFYRGELGRRIAAGLQREGSPLDAGDLARFECRRVAQPSVRYRAGTLRNLPPPTVGITSLTILGILDRFDLSGLEPMSAEFVHLHAEAAKLAHALRDRHLGDPDFVDVPVHRMLAPATLDALAARIDRTRAAPFNDGPLPGDTVWFGVADGQGRSVSAIQSLCWEYGSGVMAGDTGIVWHNRGHGYTFEPGRANTLAPGKRPSHTLNAPTWFGDDGSRVVFGTMGGEAQPQISAAVFTRAMDLGLPLVDALATPRWVLGRAWGDQSPTTLKLERRFPEATAEGLRALGHDVEWFDEWSDYMGHAGVIRIGVDGAMDVGSDPRSDGAAGAL
jgi:gamma-glutamyltranspeptidase/glutathione hydrolase